MRCIGLILLAVLVSCASAQADVNVTISTSQQQMIVAIDGGPTYRWPVSTGRSGYNTPNGSFGAIRLERVYFSKKYDDAPMPNSIFFHGGYAIHGTLEERRLGNAVSHGCVRLSRANAALLYAAVQAHGMSRTHIRITDSPIYSVAPAYAHRYDRRESYEASSRRYDRRYRVAPSYRDFDEFDVPRYRESQRYIYWDEAPRRVYRDDGWRRY
jgi:hypothetical protein